MSLFSWGQLIPNEINENHDRGRDQAPERRAQRGDIGGGAPKSLAYFGAGGWDIPPVNGY